MNAAQTAKYFAEFGKLRDVLRAKGWSGTKIELHRHALTKRALGHDKSSKEFTNADLDKVLAVIAAETAPADFDAQMRLQDQPERRRSILTNRIIELARHIDVDPQWQGKYIDGMARRMFGHDRSVDCTERELQKIEGALRAMIRRKHTAEECNRIERMATDAAERATRGEVRPIEQRNWTKAAVAAITGQDEGDPF